MSALALVVVAAGSGTRFGGPKQWAPLAARPLLAHCLDALGLAQPEADRVVVLPEELLESASWHEVNASLAQAWRAVAGGATRALSGRSGVEAARGEIVAVHDGARPFPPVDALREAVALLREKPALAGAIVCAPVTDTLKQLDDAGLITGTIDRARCARAETPQVCRRERLLNALARPGTEDCTDEARVAAEAWLRRA